MKRNSTLLYFVNKIYVKQGLDVNDLGQFAESMLTGMEYEPSGQCIKNILDFASSYEVIETDSTGHVEMNLN
jgi:hypothetical protein